MNGSRRVSFVGNKARRWCFRLLVIPLSLSPLVLLELACLVCGAGRPDLQVDPFVGFANSRPLFVKSADGDRYEIAQNRQLCFRPDSFAHPKPPGEFRVFCLGGSTVQGRPFAIETSFTSWLELSLQAADPNRPWEVVNCGGISYASYRLVPILEEVLAYEPDLIILYTGHNEFLEDRSYASLKYQPPWLRRSIALASRLHSFHLLRNFYRRIAAADRPSTSRSVLPEEVRARLDYDGGLEKYHRDLSWKAGVASHFQFNLERMAGMCQAHQVPLWLVDPVSNLQNCPPFKSASGDSLSDSQRKQWQRLREEASHSYRPHVLRAIELLEQAAQLDDQHAGVFYDLGKCYLLTGDFDRARSNFLLAKENDICPLRITEPLRAAIRTVAERHGLPVIPVYQAFCEKSRGGIPGDHWMADHVHPSIPGHQFIAELMMSEFCRQGMVTPTGGWQARRDRLFQEQIARLPENYYVQGWQRLENLRRWTEGRSTLGPYPNHESQKGTQLFSGSGRSE